MKTQILKSLFFFFLQIPAFCICSNAQIIYTDIIPDKTCNTDGCTYNLDLNNNGIIDFTIDQIVSLTSSLDCSGTKTIYQVKIMPLSGNATLINKRNFPYPTELNYGDLINSDSTFQSGCQDLAKDKWNCFMGSWQEKKSGAWISGATDKYLGLRMTIANDSLYGWARLDVGTNGTSFTIKDYAYNSISNQPIFAGDTGKIATGIHIIKGTFSIVVSPNPVQNSTQISFFLPQTENTSIVIYNLTGRIIKVLADKMMSAGNHQLQWNTSNQTGNAVSNGIYLLRMQTASKSKTILLSVVK